jgi:hypothetical protein
MRILLQLPLEERTLGEDDSVQFKPSAIANSTFFKNYPQPVTATMAQTEEQSRRQPARQQQQLTRVVDVFGQETEPICNYHTCHHKFSLHGLSGRVCKCTIRRIIL